MQLLEHFKELTLHPKNAEELKGLILQLAVQGKLTRQWREENLDVEPGSELLKRIRSEKGQLIKEKKIKKENAFPEISSEEIPFNLPESWAWSRLGDYIHNFGQKTPDKEFEYIDVASIDNQLGVIKNELNILSPKEAPSRARKIVQKGCVVYSTVRPYLLNIAVVDREFSYEAIASTAFAILNPILGCSEIYLCYVLRSYFFIEYVESCMKGVAYPAINDANLLVGLIPIPPLEEQKAIVEVVNQLFAEVEQLEALTKERIQLKADFVTSALNQLTQAAEQDTASQWVFLQEHFGAFFTEIGNIKKLREGILQLAVQGKLTHHWRATVRLSGVKVEFAATLLEKIKAEKEQLIKAGRIKKEKPPSEISDEEIPYELPEGWVWCRLGEIITFLNGYAFKSSTYVETSNYQVIRLGNVKNDRFLINTKQEFVPEPIGIETLDFKLYENDILTTLTGTKNRRDYCFTCIVQSKHVQDRTMLLNQRVGCIRAIDKSSSELMNKFLKSDVILDQLFTTETGTANQGNIGSSAFKNLVYPFPPKEEQKAIVEKINALMTLCDYLEQEIETHQTTQEQWVQSCLKEVVEF